MFCLESGAGYKSLLPDHFHQHVVLSNRFVQIVKHNKILVNLRFRFDNKTLLKSVVNNFKIHDFRLKPIKEWRTKFLVIKYIF